MTLNLKEQVQLIEEVLEFKKRVTILKMSPSAEEFEDFRRKCKKLKFLSLMLMSYLILNY